MKLWNWGVKVLKQPIYTNTKKFFSLSQLDHTWELPPEGPTWSRTVRWAVQPETEFGEAKCLSEGPTLSRTVRWDLSFSPNGYFLCEWVFKPPHPNSHSLLPTAKNTLCELNSPPQTLSQANLKRFQARVCGRPKGQGIQALHSDLSKFHLGLHSSIFYSWSNSS